MDLLSSASCLLGPKVKPRVQKHYRQNVYSSTIVELLTNRAVSIDCSKYFMEDKQIHSTPHRSFNESNRLLIMLVESLGLKQRALHVSVALIR